MVDCQACVDFAKNWTGDIPDVFLGGAAGAVLAIVIMFAIVLGLAIYVYHALAWMTIAKKRKYKKAWLAWIPFASSAMRLQLGKKFHWAWVFLYLIPIVGWIAIWILLIVSHWKIFEMFRYPGWLSLAPLVNLLPRLSGLGTFAYLVIVGIVAWKKN
jgi:hypothetical protein